MPRPPHHESHGDRQRDETITLKLVPDQLEKLLCFIREHLNPLARIEQKVNNVMSAISEFAARQNAHNDKIDAAITGLEGDNKAMTELIQKLQASPGTFTPEDQATVDALEARTAGQAAKLEALDALTPPPPPTA